MPSKNISLNNILVFHLCRPGIFKLDPGGPVFESLASTCLYTPAWKFQVYLVRPWLAASGVFE